MPLTVNEITRLLKVRGDSPCDREPVSPLEHALQCAHLAEQAGASNHLTVAALLHDLGHLLAAERDNRASGDPSCDDLHPYIPLPFLRGLLPDAVLEPIRLHVDAKRYLCHTEASYWDKLSTASKHSLERQGGAFTPFLATQFLAQPYATDAVRLRRWDDQAKVPGMPTPPLAWYIGKLEQVALPDDRAIYQRLRLLVC